MHRGLLLGCVLAATAVLVVAALAVADKPVGVSTGWGGTSLNGSFLPRRLSKSEPTPIALNISGGIESAPGVHPPALQELKIEADRNGSLDLIGDPNSAPFLQDGRGVLEKCTVIGEGTASFEIEFPEQPPIETSGKLLLLNGPLRAGGRRLYAATILTVPTPAVLVARIDVRRIASGRFGTAAIVSVPKVAGGSGSLTSFDLTIGKTFIVEGQKVSPVKATCSDRKLRGRAEAIFVDGAVTKTHVVRGCTPER
jgi:hypothetical protein